MIKVDQFVINKVNYSRSPCCVLLALSWNTTTTNENPSTDKLSRAINQLVAGLGDWAENIDDGDDNDDEDDEGSDDDGSDDDGDGVEQ